VKPVPVNAVFPWKWLHFSKTWWFMGAGTWKKWQSGQETAPD
jgi:hypothetical protein